MLKLVNFIVAIKKKVFLSTNYLPNITGAAHIDSFVLVVSRKQHSFTNANHLQLT